MSDELVRWLWSELDQYRRRCEQYTLSDIFQNAVSNGFEQSLQTLYTISIHLRPTGTFVPPPWLINFIAQYAEQFDFPTLLDPWAGVGSLVATVAQHAGYEQAYGIVRTNEEHWIATELYPSSEGMWMFGDPLDILDEIERQVSLIVGIPPFGQRPEQVTFEGIDGPIDVRDDIGNLALLKACRKLTEAGVGIFVVPAGFIIKSGNTVYNTLHQFGLYVNSVLAIPAGAFEPLTNISSQLVIISRSQYDEYFVGELSNNSEHNQSLLANLLAREPAEEIRLGTVVASEEFTTFESLVARKRLERLVAESGLTGYPLVELALEINRTRAKDPPGFKEKDNAVYLPLIGRSEAVTSPDQFKLKPHNYAQLVLDPDKAIADYVAGFFSSPIGLLVREVNQSGITIPKLSSATLQQAYLYLPDKAIQLRVIEIDNYISNLQSELGELQAKAWTHPIQIDQTSHAVDAYRSLTAEERFVDWMDSLPFPLGSILWTYHTIGANQKSQYEQLLHFFEALVAFYATILLSGFIVQPQVYSQVQEKLQESFGYLRKSSYGSWLRIAQFLGKRIEKMVSDDNQKLIAQNMFHMDDEDQLSILYNRSVFSEAEKVNELRNRWQGHTGYVTDAIAEERHSLIRSHVERVRQAIGRQWTSCKLIKPGDMRYQKNMYRCHVEELMGTRTPFPSLEISSTIPLETGSLYLWPEGDSQPIKILPLIKIMPSPASAHNACYFYNRLTEQTKARYIAYHFETATDIILDFAEAERDLELIFPDVFK